MKLMARLYPPQSLTVREAFTLRLQEQLNPVDLLGLLYFISHNSLSYFRIISRFKTNGIEANSLIGQLISQFLILHS
jgi:hypothetical protein